MPYRIVRVVGLALRYPKVGAGMDPAQATRELDFAAVDSGDVIQP
jgi:hypothetical protein